MHCLYSRQKKWPPMATISYRLYDYTQLSLYPPSNRYRMRFFYRVMVKYYDFLQT